MPIPHLDSIRRPALELLAQRNSLTKIGEVFDLLAPRFSLTEEDLAEILPSGIQRTWHNRANWACYDLFRAGLLDRPKKGFYQINPRGLEVLKSPPERITRPFLSQISKEFSSFLTPTGQPKAASASYTNGTMHEEGVEETPEEVIAEAVATLDHSLRAELLEQLLKVNPYRFEQVVIDLLFAMGYGGSRAEAAQVTKKSGDEGIDGVINEDRLGLDVIYVQAKRWKSTVGRPDIQSFVGALAGKQAQKGIFITTSDFAKNAFDYANSVSQKVILIDGQRLASLMIEHGVGVSKVRTIEIQRLDSDYFEEG